MSLARSLMAWTRMRLASLMTGASSLEAASWSRLTSSTVSLATSRLSASASASRLLLRVLDDVLHGAALGGVNGVQLVDDGLFRGDQRRDFQLGDALDIVHGQDVERVGHGQEQLVVQPGDGQDFVIVRHVARHQVRHFRRNADAGEIDRRGVQDAAHADDQVVSVT